MLALTVGVGRASRVLISVGLWVGRLVGLGFFFALFDGLLFAAL